jgi:hypothetical protein
VGCSDTFWCVLGVVGSKSQRILSGMVLWCRDPGFWLAVICENSEYFVILDVGY